MRIISNKSREFKINLFADFIISKISPSESSIIQIVDCSNFWIIKGKTSSREILDLTKLKEEFIENFNEHFDENFVFQTIDLIEYGCEINSVQSFEIMLYNSVNCSYKKEQIEFFLKNSEKNIPDDDLSKNFGLESLFYFSTFPHGYSLDQGRTLFYYCKFICQNLSKSYLFDKLIFKISEEDNERNFKIINPQDYTTDEKLTSCILDFFDFDFVKINKKVLTEGFFNESLNPLANFKFVENSEIKLEIF